MILYEERGSPPKDSEKSGRNTVNQKLKIIYISIICIAIMAGEEASAGNSFLYKEANLITGYSSEDKWVGKSSTLLNSVGFEHYAKFSNEYGDYLTTDLQARFAYDSLEDSSDAWALEVHNAWLEYKLAAGTNLKFGHFDPAFGLEPIVDTHGTILQTLAMKDIGFKKDWGVALKGALSKFDYKAALQLGSGMSIRRRDGSFLATLRAGSPAGDDFQYGISGLYGEVLKTSGMETIPRNDLLSDNAVRKKRIGLDGQYNYNAFLFKGEAAYGADGSEDVLGYLAEVNYTFPGNQNWQAKCQFQSWINDLDDGDSDDSTASLALSYKVNHKITVRAAFLHDFNLVNNPEDTRFMIQLYYYGA